jgi:hypothetical protein
MTSTLSGMDPQRRAAVRALLIAEVNATATPSAGPARTGAAATNNPGSGPSVRKPMWRRPLVRRIGLGVASVAAVTVTAAAMLIGDPVAPPSYASWTAVPTTAPGGSQDAGDIQEQASKCHDLTGATIGIAGVPRRAKQAAQRSVLVDRRGDWTFCVDITKGAASASDPLIVLAGLKGQEYQSVSGTVWDKPYAWPEETAVSVLGGNPVGTPDQQGDDVNFSLIGSCGPDVAGVDINLADGTVITTTLHEDFWAAWWPGRVTTARVDTLTVHTTNGESYDVDPRTIQLPWAKYGATTPWP